MTAMPGIHLYTIPADIPFADALAAGLLEQAGGDPLALARMRVLLPTRRAGRTMREAFLRQSDGRPLMLPKLQPLGDVEEEELAIGLAGSEPAGSGLAERILALPPALPPIRRRLLLARAVMKVETFAHGPDQALVLADTLGRLMDEVLIEGLGFEALPGLVEDDRLAEHWQVTTRFLTILSETWPAILAEQGAIDAADRRNRLLHLLAEHWGGNPPETPVIVAGSNGSIPAAARLLSVIARLPQGSVVLPGLDLDMDEDSWSKLDDAHPQCTLKILLQTIGAQRKDVVLWKTLPHALKQNRMRLASEMMRPAETSDKWNDLSQNPDIVQGLSRLERIDCETPEEEAQAIALIFRHTLEQSGRTAALVTPDRALARRVVAACRRWNVAVDDSAGQPLAETASGAFLRLVLQCAAEQIAPGSLLALLRHRLCRAGMERGLLDARLAGFEKTLLRGPKPPPGFEGLRQRAASLRHAPAGLDQIVQLIERLQALFAPLTALCDGGAHPAGLWLDHHLKTAEALSTPQLLWQGEAGEAAADFFSNLRTEINLLPPMPADDYLAAIARLMDDVAVRPRYGTHPRLSVLGLLEARLLQADTVILGGLNEGKWPPDPGHDPWMSRPMRARFGLPSPERMIGLAGHDFVQGFCAAHTVLTRSIRQDNAPTVPARWLQRLDTVIRATGGDTETLRRTSLLWLAAARTMDSSPSSHPCPQPRPIPPVHARPRELPVTAIETWLQDPYGIYAKYILRLRALDPLEKPPDAAARGSFLHDVLNRFNIMHRDAWPPDAAQKLIDLGHSHYATLADDSGFWRYWLPRFDRIAHWLARHEAEWRQQASPFATELRGRIVLKGLAGPFALTARADRIDRLKQGGMAIIDYKSGSSAHWTAKAMKEGRLPQLPLEALILDMGGFPGAEGAQTECLAYWKLTGGAEIGEATAIYADDVRDGAAIAAEGLLNLIDIYDRPDTPYIALPDPERAPRFNDYAHLARVQEWSAGDEGSEAL